MLRVACDNRNVIMNTNVPESNKSLGFLDKFGREDPERSRRKAEYIEEYERFKLLDQERFRNRFAEKKNRSVNSPALHTDGSDNRISTNVLTDQPSKVVGVGDVNLEHIKLEKQMDQRLEDISRKIDALRPATTGVVTEEFGYEHLLRDRLNNLQEAEEKLAAIEREYNQARNALMGKVQRELLTSSLQWSPITPSSNVYLANSSTQSINQSRKHLEQEQLRKELEQQIREAKARREASNKSDIFSVDDRQSTPINSQELIPISAMINSSRLDYSFEENQSALAPQVTIHGHTPGLYTSPIRTPGQYHQQTEQTQWKAAESESAKKAKYARELREQIEECRKRKEMQKKLDEEYERKLEEACIKHNLSIDSSENVSKSDAMVANRNIEQVANEPEQNKFARGGHGIFGNPLSVEQKTVNQKYKEELAKQIEEKRARDEELKRKQQEEEQKEAERVAAEQRKMQAMFEEERKRLKKHEQEAELFAETQKIATDYEQPELLPEKLQPVITKQDHMPEPIQRKGSPPKQPVEPELLIGSQITKKRDSNARLAKQEIEITRVLKQLQDLKSRVDFEKARVTEALGRPSLEGGGDHYAELDRRRPKVTKKAANLFGTSLDAAENRRDSYSGGTAADKLTILDYQQLAYMRSLDENLRKLNARDFLTDIELHRQRFFRPELQIHDTDSSRYKIPEETSALKRTSSESSIDVDKIQANNRKRLQRLNHAQLENQSEAETEKLLDDFVKKCDLSS